MRATDGALLLLASAAAGAVNSVAGGGTLLSFPAAIAAGLPPIVANATNAVSLIPGSLAAAWAYRRDLAGVARLLLLLLPPAGVGAALGAAILRRTPERLFDAVVPWLVLGATLLILLQELIARRLPGAAAAEPPANAAGRRAWPKLAVLIVCQLLVGIYGGYFGAAMGIVMLAFLGLLGLRGPRALHEINAIKNGLAVLINGVAAADFVIHRLVDLPTATIMAAGATAGGILGGRLGRRAAPRTVRRWVVAIGFAMTAVLAYRAYRS